MCEELRDFLMLQPYRGMALTSHNICIIFRAKLKTTMGTTSYPGSHTF